MAFLVALAALFGAVVGSFLTVVVSRIGTGETIVRGRSHCIHCGKNLCWYELLPVLSFLAQGGQCCSCRGAIPRTYLAIELITAGLFAFIAWGVLAGAIAAPPFERLALSGKGLGAFLSALRSPLSAHIYPLGAIRYPLVFAYYAYFTATAIAISFYDLAHRLIPNALITPLAIIGAITTLTGAFISRDFASHLLVPFVCAVLAFLVFWSLWFFSRGRAMGRGDADIAFAIALYLGPLASALAILFSFWIGSILGILLVALGLAGFRSHIPFAPFLFAGAITALFAAEPIIENFAHLW